jgi:nucleotide-binding universal stress UspA family protein
LDDSAAGRKALRAGFAESTLRQRPLLVVRSWEPVDFTAALLHPYDGRDRLSAADRDAYLKGMLTPLRVEFPSVDVTVRETWDSVPDSLLTADAEAELIVIGRHSDLGSRRHRLGSLAAELLHQATVPLMVVGGEAPASATTLEDRCTL